MKQYLALLVLSVVIPSLYAADISWRTIDTPRAFSITIVSILSFEASKKRSPDGIGVSESTFRWNERCVEWLIDSIGEPPEGGNLEYDATRDRLNVYSDYKYYKKLYRFLQTKLPDDFPDLEIKGEK